MCEQQLVVDDVSNNPRRSKAHQLVMLTSCNGNYQFASRTSPYRTLCILTAGLAFILGLVVGVMIPLYVLPRGVASSRLNVNTSRPTESQRRNNYIKATTEFASVSFVANSAAPVAVVRPSVDTGGLLQEGVYWGRRVEDAMPAGFEESEAESWRRFARKTPVVKV